MTTDNTQAELGIEKTHKLIDVPGWGKVWVIMDIVDYNQQLTAYTNKQVEAYHNEITDNEKKVWLHKTDLEDRIAKARINERNQIALDNYRGKTISESTNWQAMYGRFMDGNERTIAELSQTLKERKEK